MTQLLSDIVFAGPIGAIASPVIEDWQTYSPSAYNGFGTPTAETLEYRIVGSSMEIRGGFTPSTATASEARIELPPGFTIGGTSTNSEKVGLWGVVLSTANDFYMLGTSGDTFLNVGYIDTTSGSDDLAPTNADNVAGGGLRVSITASVPIAGLQAEQLIGSVVEATSTEAGLVTSYNSIIKSSVHSVSAGYTVLDDDGFSKILVTTGASNISIFLPLAANNEGRKIDVAKMDAGIGAILLKPNAADNINGTTTFNDMDAQFDGCIVVCDGSDWIIVAKSIA